LSSGAALQSAGSVGGNINSSMISHSDEPAVIEGNPASRVARSACVETPAGFATNRVPVCDRSSYEEIRP